MHGREWRRPVFRTKVPHVTATAVLVAHWCTNFLCSAPLSRRRRSPRPPSFRCSTLATDDPMPRPAAVAIAVQPALEKPLGPSGASLPAHRRELRSIGWRDSGYRVGDHATRPCRSRRRARTRSAAFVKSPVLRLQSHCCPRRAGSVWLPRVKACGAWGGRGTRPTVQQRDPC